MEQAPTTRSARTLGGVLGLYLIWSGAAQANVAPPEALMATSLPGTMASTLSLPDAELELADAAALDRFGVPPRPDPHSAPRAYAAWYDGVSGMQRLVPVLQPVPIHHGPMLPAPGAALAPAAAYAHSANSALSANWSGYVAPASAFSFGAQSLTRIAASWVIPVAQPAFDACRHPRSQAAVYSSSWVGLDGSGSFDVLQAGTESDATCTSGVLGAFHSAWYEWYPYNEVRIANLPVAPGDTIYAQVWAVDAISGRAYLANKTRHQSVSVRFEAPPGIRLVGNSAEWVVERPAVQGALATLTNYVEEFFAGALATDASGHNFTPGTGPAGALPPLQVQMTDADSEVISVPSLLGQDAIWFTDQGSARHLRG